jgi:hypothetical protein
MVLHAHEQAKQNQTTNNIKNKESHTNKYFYTPDPTCPSCHMMICLLFTDKLLTIYTLMVRARPETLMVGARPKSW